MSSSSERSSCALWRLRYSTSTTLLLAPDTGTLSWKTRAASSLPSNWLNSFPECFILPIFPPITPNSRSFTFPTMGLCLCATGNDGSPAPFILGGTPPLNQPHARMRTQDITIAPDGRGKTRFAAHGLCKYQTRNGGEIHTPSRHPLALVRSCFSLMGVCVF